MQWLSVDEFMCLLFERKPGTVKFDYGDPKDWPENADIVYKLLSADIRAENLLVTFDDPHRDPRNYEFFSEAYDQPGNPWWEDGRLFKNRLVKWLTDKNIPSVFFGVVPSPTVISKQESGTEQTTQAPAQYAATEENHKKTDEANSLSKSNIYYLSKELLSEKQPEPEFCVNPLVPIEAVTILSAQGGTGKSFFALKMALHIALGLPIIGAETKVGKVAYMSLEDPENILNSRVSKIFNSLPEDARQRIDELETNAMIIGRYGLPSHMAEIKFGNIVTTQIAHDLTALLQKHEIKCVFIDTFIRTNTLNENDNAHMGGLLVSFEKIAKEAKCSVVLIHHTVKSGGSKGNPARGAGAIIDNARSALLMETVNDKRIKVQHVKSNYSAKHPDQYLKMIDGILLEDSDALKSLPTSAPGSEKQRYKELYDWWVKDWGGKPLSKWNIDDAAAKAIRPDGSKHGKELYKRVLSWAFDEGLAKMAPPEENQSKKPNAEFYTLNNLKE